MHCMQTPFSFLGFKLLKTCKKPPESPSQMGQTPGDPAIFTAPALEKYSWPYLRNTAWGEDPVLFAPPHATWLKVHHQQQCCTRTHSGKDLVKNMLVKIDWLTSICVKPLPCTCWRDDGVLLMQHKSPSDTTYAALVLSGAPLLICSCTLVFWCNWCMGASSTAHRHLLQRNPRFKWTWESGKNYPTLGARLFQRTLA